MDYEPTREDEMFNAIQVGQFSGLHAFHNPQKYVKTVDRAICSVDSAGNERIFKIVREKIVRWRFEKV